MYITHYTGLVVIALQDCILPFYTMHCTIGRILFITRSTALHSAIVVVAIIQSDKAVYLYLTVIWCDVMYLLILILILSVWHLHHVSPFTPSFTLLIFCALNCFLPFFFFPTLHLMYYSSLLFFSQNGKAGKPKAAVVVSPAAEKAPDDEWNTITKKKGKYVCLSYNICLPVMYLSINLYVLPPCVFLHSYDTSWFLLLSYLS